MPIGYSVIIPTLNQSAKLTQCLRHLSAVSFDHDAFEVLVIDNGSSDDTKDVALSFRDEINNLQYHFCETPGLMAARHFGCEKAKGDILCYLDDDSLVTKDWLKAISESFADKTVAMVGGPCIPEYEIKPPKWVTHFWVETKHGRIHRILSLLDFGNQKLVINPSYVYGCNYSIRKEVFLEFGGTNPDYFPERYQQFIGDGESGLAVKIGRSHYRAVYEPRAMIHHLIPQSRLTVDYFCWKRFYNGIHGSFRALRKQHGIGHGHDKEVLGFTRKLYRGIKRAIRVYSGQKGHKNANAPAEVKRIRDKMQESYEAGYRFHQEQVKKNPKLFEWVLRENYLGENGKLPIEKG